MTQPGKMRFWVNDRLVEEDGVAPTTTLLRYLREQLGLTGTKEGCAEGDCGACTVAILDPDAPGGPTYRAVNACLVLLPMVQGRRVLTVEGLKQGATYHPVQEALAKHLGSQCGYCTPGVAMSMFEAAYRTDLTEPWQLDDQLCGNLCRCTGYRPIKDAAREVAGSCRKDSFGAALARPAREDRGLAYQHGAQSYFNPVSLPELLELLAKHPSARLVAGGTDLSLEVTKRFAEPPLLISLEALPELRGIERTAAGTRIGAAVTLTELQEGLGKELPALDKMLRVFASRQIKNRATIGGNLCNASPIGDLAPVLIALGAVALLRSAAGLREVALQEFFLSYRKTALAAGEFLEAVRIPPIPADARVSSFKVSKRRELDISAVSAGAWLRLSGGNVAELRLCYGGLAATPARATRTEAALTGGPWSRGAVEAALPLLEQDFTPLSDHRGSAWYRGRIAKNLLLGFFLQTEETAGPLQDRPSSTVQLRRSR